MRKRLVLVAGILILAAVNGAIFVKERHLAHGEVIYLELAPVDPRSLMQGDYMALNYAIGNQVQGALRRQGADTSSRLRDGHIIVRRDHQGIAHFQRLDDGASALQEKEMRLRYRVRNGRVQFASNAFFFQEGYAERYEAARFGQFRVNANGEPLLVALYDGALKALGDDQAPPSSIRESLTLDDIDKQFVEQACPHKRCAEVSIKAIQFPEAPQLTAQLQASLLRLAGSIEGETDSPEEESWEMFAERFLAEAKSVRQAYPELPGYQADLEAVLRARHDDLLVIELRSYLYTGGAHGISLTEFMVIDEREERVVDFDDMLIAGQDEAFYDALERAHLRWLQEIEGDTSFTEHWPITVSHNVAPLQDVMIVKYNVYDIAPYAVGQPELRIPLQELEGTIASRYLGK